MDCDFVSLLSRRARGSVGNNIRGWVEFWEQKINEVSSIPWHLVKRPIDLKDGYEIKNRQTKETSLLKLLKAFENAAKRDRKRDMFLWMFFLQCIEATRYAISYHPTLNEWF